MSGAGLFCQINTAASGPEETAKKHVPVITVQGDVKSGEPCTVNIKVGAAPHVMEKEHFVQFVDLYCGNIYIARIDFTAELTKPEATLTIVLHHAGTRKLKAFSRCNIHGMWEGTAEVNVT